MKKIVKDNVANGDKTAIIKMWILQNLKIVDRNNYDYQMGVVEGMKRVLRFIYGYNTTTDKDISKAYALVKKRTGCKKNVL